MKGMKDILYSKKYLL